MFRRVSSCLLAVRHWRWESQYRVLARERATLARRAWAAACLASTTRCLHVWRYRARVQHQARCVAAALCRSDSIVAYSLPQLPRSTCVFCLSACPWRLSLWGVAHVYFIFEVACVIGVDVFRLCMLCVRSQDFA